MLLVRTRVGPSRINGLGLFAAEPIAAGTPVWRFTPGFDLEVDASEAQRQPEPLRATLLHYGYIDKRSGRYILSCDDARFINHSADPNLVSDFSQDPRGVDVARHNIAANEELTIDYGEVEGERPLSAG